MGYFVLNGRKIEGVAFDMDGTLIDCEPINRAAVQSAAGEQFPIDWAQCAGKKESIIHAWLQNEYGAENISSNRQAFVDACKTGYKDRVSELEARMGMMALLNVLKALGVPVIVVTNTEKDMAMDKLAQCDMVDYMYDVIGSDTLADLGMEAKPSPDGYQLAAEILGILTKNMMGLEDSGVGMDALSQTDALSVHITDYGTPAHSKADIVLSGMGSAEILALTNQIIRENYQRLLGLDLAPQPSSPAYA